LPLYGLPVAAATVDDSSSVRTLTHNAVKLSAGGGATRSGMILLNVGAIDTSAPESAALRESAGSFEGKRLHLVQFAGPIQPSWYRAVQATGVEVIQYIPDYAYMVYGDATAISRLQDLAVTSEAVQWDGPFLSRYKVQPGAQADRRVKLGLPADNDLFTVQLVQDKQANAATVQFLQDLSGAPALNRWDVLKYTNVLVSLPVQGVDAVAARPDVVSIERFEVPRMFDERQDRIVTGQLSGGVPTPGDYLAYLAAKGFTQAQFTASNFTVDVTDSGVDNATTNPNHFGLHVGGMLANPSRVVYNRLEGTPHGGSTLQGCDGHGNLNTHIVAGYVPDPATLPNPAVHADANAFRYGLGVCPFVKVGSSVIFDPSLFTNPNLPNLQARAYNDNARISTNSWGANVGGAYDAASQTFDALVRDAQPAGSAFPTAGNQEMVVVFAAGNAGPGAGSTGSPATAKNVISVGASENVQAFGGADFRCGITDAGADSANDIIGFSSRGPTTDGRFNPLIVAPGTHVSGGVFQASATTAGTGAAGACYNGASVCGGVGSIFFPSSGQQFYTASSGTSHATPGVAGGAALIRQHFINLAITPPSPAMTKALLGNSARYMNGVGANDTLPSNNQGLGMMNLDTFFNQLAAPVILHDELASDMFTASGQSRNVVATVASAAEPLRVTLAWTDAPGPITGAAYVNNLDLEVTVGGNVYRGNVFTGANSSSGGVADTRNNTESVFLPAGQSGAFSVRVLATNIAGDGVPGVGGALDQDYALVISNATPSGGSPVIGGGTTTLMAEGCAPANNALDPNEAATVSFCLRNVGTADTVATVGTLQATGGVTSPSGPQVYGVLVAGGPEVCRNFTFTVGALTCGATVTAGIQVQDGATNLGTSMFNFVTGVPNTTPSFSENFDAATPPALPAGWTSVSGAGADTWTTITTTPDTAPNVAFINDPPTVSDTYLVSPNIAVPTTTDPVIVSFRNSYVLENTFDGAVLEINVAGGGFQDVIAAGGSFVAGGYNGTISTLFSSPIAGRAAWTSTSGGYITSTVTLPASVSGQMIQLRWRRASDTSVGAAGWRVDTISILVAGRLCCGGAGGASADLSITKTDGQTTYVPGQPVTYTIVASNAGPDPVVGAAVADTFPADLTGVSWTCTASVGSSCTSPAGTGNIATTVSLLNAGTATFTASGVASIAAAGSISNTATVAAPAGVTDPAPGNNSATDIDTRTSVADLSITKDDGSTFYRPGQTLTYTIVVSNAGPDTATGATVTDTFPANLTGVAWTCTASAGSSCAAPSGTGNINTTVTLLMSGSATFTVTATAALTATGSIANTADVAAPGGQVDPNPANNSATDTDTRQGGNYYAVQPCRILDTRGPIGSQGGPALDAGQRRTFQVTGLCNIPANATAIHANVTAVNPGSPGFFQVIPTGAPIPVASTVNYVTGRTRANNGIFQLVGGTVDIRCQQTAGTTTHAVLDVAGYFID
jgi:uncharacterized repeat protein (TIGR01451 family)